MIFPIVVSIDFCPGLSSYKKLIWNRISNV